MGHGQGKEPLPDAVASLGESYRDNQGAVGVSEAQQGLIQR